MKRLVAINPFIKFAITIFLFVLSYLFMSQLDFKSVGYISMFAGLFVLFEGFGLALFIKILIALVLGVIISTTGAFLPADIIAIKPVGSKIFMNLLTMALVPLVFSSILVGVAGLGDIAKLGKIGIKTFAYYLITTAVAITIGLVVANVFSPGGNLSPEVKEKFESTYKASATQKTSKAKKNQQTLFQTMQAITPKNIMESISGKRPDMLALIFFAVFCGIALLKIEPKFSAPVISFFTGITEMTISLIIMVMRIAPYGIFAIIASTIAETEGPELLLALIPFSLCVLLGLLIHVVGVNTFSLKVLSKRSPIEFFKNAKEVMLTAFSTASSGATMPLTLQTAKDKLGVSSEAAGFVIPLGATVNMDGTALFQGVSAFFLANIYGIDLAFGDQVTIVIMAVMASVGTAAVPGVGIVILTMILMSVGIPPEGILFILPVNHLLDMCRTSVNVAGDMACAVYIDKSTKDREG